MATKGQKRGTAGGGTIRQKGNSWEARITIGRDPGTGKQIQKSIYGKTKTEVRKKMTAALADIDKGLYVEPQKTTVKQWLDEWKMTYKGDKTENTMSKYESDIRLHILPKIGNVQLQALRPHHIQKMLNELADKHSRKSLVCIKGVLSTALHQAYINGLIASNPCEKVTIPKAGNAKREIRPLTQNEINDFLSVIRESNYEDIIKVTLFTGMRMGEVSGLQWRNIDFENGIIIIDHQLKRKRDATYCFSETKTHMIRKIKPAPSVMSLLAQHKKRQAAQRLKAGNQWNEEPFDDLVFVNEFGKFYGSNTLLHNVRKLAARVGVDGFTFHDLRHTFAVTSILAGDDIYTISKTLGHSSIKITLDTYSHYTDDLRNKASMNMENFMQGLSNL